MLAILLVNTSEFAEASVKIVARAGLLMVVRGVSKNGKEGSVYVWHLFTGDDVATSALIAARLLAASASCLLPPPHCRPGLTSIDNTNYVRVIGLSARQLEQH